MDPLALVSLVEDDPDHFSLDGPYKFKFSWQSEANADERITRMEALLGKLGASASEVPVEPAVSV